MNLHSHEYEFAEPLTERELDYALVHSDYCKYPTLRCQEKGANHLSYMGINVKQHADPHGGLEVYLECPCCYIKIMAFKNVSSVAHVLRGFDVAMYSHRQHGVCKGDRLLMVREVPKR